MALWEFKNLNKYGNLRTRIIYTKGSLGIPGKGVGPIVFAKRFKYEFRHAYMPPTIFKNNGKTYLMPLWQEVIDGTTLDDVDWIRPKPVLSNKSKQTPITTIHTSKSNADKTYKTTYYPETKKYQCSCPGSFRAFDKRCLHIKEMEIKINKTI